MSSNGHTKAGGRSRRHLAAALGLYFSPTVTISPLLWCADALDWFVEMRVAPDYWDLGSATELWQCAETSAEKAAAIMATSTGAALVATEKIARNGRSYPLAYQMAQCRRHPLELLYMWDSSDSQLDVELIADRLDHILKFGTPVYGIGYQRPYRLGPELYVGGILCNHSDYSDAGLERADIVSRWNHNLIDAGQNEHLIGRQRDVYPINILSRIHLDRSIEGTLLRRWIESNPAARGTLHEVADQLWIWRVPDSIREDVRCALTRAGLLVCRREGETMADV